jgi:phospholipid/cholesterol/gamma-HCH transport system permease protein
MAHTRQSSVVTPTAQSPPAASVGLARTDDAELAIAIAGDWTIGRGLMSTSKVEQALATDRTARVRFEARGLGEWDSALVVFAERVGALCAERAIPLDLTGLPGGLANLVNLARAVPERTGTGKGGAGEPFLVRLGEGALAKVKSGGQQVAFLGEVGIAIWRLLRGRAVFRRQDLLLFMRACGPQAFGIVAVINLLIGMILAFIGAVQLQRFGAGIYVANLVGIAVVREMAAVMTGIVLAGRTGAAFAAQLGTMQAQEEIDALTTLGVPPIEFLVLPRALALAIMMPLLYLYASLIGLVGGMFVAMGMLGLSLTVFVDQTLGALDVSQVLIGLSKSVVFGILVAVAGCLRGMQAGRSAAGVGDAATAAVVTGILYIIVTDAAFAVVLSIIGI